jgi:hypothetical protein
MLSIIILGFGRSGTTWVSDIISKNLGYLILFEPFHPSVTVHSQDISYETILSDRAAIPLKSYLHDIVNKRHRKMWLLRNHVPGKLEDISEDLINMLWRECNIAGFKEIRANFMIDWFHHNFNSKIVFVVRHPCAVVASIKKRGNFWEFGWPETYELFLERTIYSEKYRNHKINKLAHTILEAKTSVEKYALMWAITHAIVLPQMEQLNLPVFYYEDFYTEPFHTTKKLLRYLNYLKINIHPSYLFTPSMTTLKTLHGLYIKEKIIAEKGSAYFWEKELTTKDVDSVMEIVRHFGIDIYDESGFPVKNQNQEKLYFVRGRHMVQTQSDKLLPRSKVILAESLLQGT